jgi:hypothetical protein
MLRNAIAVALREKTAVHLALPVDIQVRIRYDRELEGGCRYTPVVIVQRLCACLK